MPTLRWILGVTLALAESLAAEEAASSLHFRPRDHPLGDVHPYFHEGECFLYYLKPGKYEAALARSRDLRHWVETPLTHEAAKPEDWLSPYYVLGVLHDAPAGVFRSFYGHKEGRMVSSTSADLLHWACAPKAYHVPPADYYQRRRDPYVFWIPEAREYGCVMTAWMKGRSKESGGAIGLATSPDLKEWRDHGPILDPGNIGEPECPQMFRLGETWYLLASIYDRAVGQPVYWMSTQPRGPWDSAPAGRLDGKDLCAAQIAFDGTVPLLLGWVPEKPAKPGQQTWGGSLALPREVWRLPNGLLGTRLPEKLSKAFATLPWQDFPEMSLASSVQTAGPRWDRLAFECTLTMPSKVREVRLILNPLGEVTLRRDQLRVIDAKGEGWSELPTALPDDMAFPVRLFVDGDVVELFVDDRFSLAARLPFVEGRLSLGLASDGEGARMTNLRLSEWLDQP